MQNPITQDRKIKDLLSRVGEDVGQLKSDVASLLSHTGRHTLPTGARDLRDSAKDRLHAGGQYAVSQFRSHPAQSSAGLLGGLLLLGAVGAGIYYLCKCDSGSCSGEEESEEN
jgi:hypothetical protein